MRSAFAIAIAVSLVVAFGCRGDQAPQPVDPQSPLIAASRDPMLQEIAKLPPEQRQAYVDERRDEIAKKSPEFALHLYNLGVRVTPRRKDK